MVLASCGTRSAYNRHLRHKENPCASCKQANNEWVKLWSRNNKNQWKNINVKAQAKYRAKPETIKKRRAAGVAYIHSEQGKAVANRSYHRRRARIRANVAEIYTLTDVINAYGSICYICGVAINLKAPRKTGKKGWENGLHIDHVIPICKNGADVLENVRPTHALCNLKKAKTA